MGDDRVGGPPPEWLVRELVRLGVPEERARAFGRRQAFAVARSMADREREAKRSRPGEGK